MYFGTIYAAAVFDNKICVALWAETGEDVDIYMVYIYFVFPDGNDRCDRITVQTSYMADTGYAFRCIV